MNMKWIDKGLLGLLSVLVILMGLLLLSAAVGFPLDTAALQNAAAALVNPWVALGTCAFALVLIAIAVRLLIALFDKNSKEPQNVIVHRNESGSSYMTVNALNTMVQRHVKAEEQVRECKTSVKVNGDAVKVIARVSAKPEAVIPAMTEQLQSSIRTYLETYSGVKVETVEVIVEATEAAGTPARVS